MIDEPSATVNPVTEILLRWEEARSGGEPRSALDLCREHPELIEEVQARIEVLEEMYAIPNSDSTRGSPPQATERVPVREEALRAQGYELLEELGSGGMGVVWKARHLELNRLVALKMILGGRQARRQDRLRFRIEAEAVAALTHPNVVQLFEVGEADGCPFLALEFVGGGTLAQRLGDRRLSDRETAKLMGVLARAADAAHRRGVVHRDLKPTNVLLAPVECGTSLDESAISLPSTPGRWVPKITDFGLAKKLGEGPGQTASGEVFGTPSYMAPEQAAGKTKEVGPATDVYALGAILYYLLTGRPPFDGATPLETILSVTNCEPVPPSQMGRVVPRDLETICLKSLHKDPARRFATAEAMAEDLRRYLDGEPIQARPIGPLERGVKWARRRPAAAALAVMSGTAALTLAGFALGFWHYRALSTALVAETAAKQRAASLLYLNHVLRAHTEWQDNHVRRAERLLDDPNCPEPFRHWEWSYLKRLCHSEERTLSGHSSLVRSLAYSPDSRLIASASEDKSVRVWDARSGELRRTLRGHPRFIYGVAFSPDGRFLASGSADQSVRIWETAGGHERLRLRGPRGFIRGVAFSPDGRLVGAASEDQAVHLWDVAAGEVRQVLRGHVGKVLAVAFAPDGRELASGSDDRTARTWDLATGQELRVLRGHAGAVTSIAYDRGGRRIATGAIDGTIRLWERGPGDESRVLEGHSSPVWGVSFSPDGDRLATASEDQTVRVWDAGTGQPTVTLRGHEKDVFCVSFSPDGLHLASGARDAQVKIWDANLASQEARVLTGHTHDVNTVAFSPDGRLLATASNDGTVGLWTIRGDRDVLRPGDPREQHVSVAFSPDGLLLAIAGSGGWVRLWDVVTRRERRAFRGHEKTVLGVAFHPDSRLLAGASADRTVRVWEVGDGRLIQALEGHTGDVNGVAFHPAGRLLASASADRTIRLWDVPSGKAVQILRGAEGFKGVAFDPDGRLLAGAGQDHKIRVWSLPDGRIAHVLEGHAGFVTCVTFSPDGRRLVSGANDRTVKLWDLGSGLEALTLKGHTDTVTGVAFSPDSGLLASSSDDRTIRIWNGTPPGR